MRKFLGSSLIFVGLVPALWHRALSSQDTPCILPPEGLIAWWPGDGDARDIAGGRDGTSVNEVQFAPGVVGEAFTFNGSNSIEVSDDPIWTLGTNSFTIDFWVNFRELGTNRAFIGHDDGTGTRNKWIFYWSPSGPPGPAAPGLRFHVQFRDPGIATVIPVFAPWIPARDHWYHLSVTREGVTFSIYIDGQIAGTGDDASVIPDPIAPLRIGWAESGYALDGMLDEVEIYNRALSAGEIQAIFAAGSGGKCKVVVQKASWGNLPVKSQAASKLVFVTHGWNSDADGWVNDIATAIAMYLSENKLSEGWDVWTYDWSEDAGTWEDFNDPALASIVRKAFFEHGEALGGALAVPDLQFKHIHFIAHSVGAYLIQAAINRLQGTDTTIHATFLDALQYEPDDAPFEDPRFGNGCAWAEQYVNRPGLCRLPVPCCLPMTNRNASAAYNIDLTAVGQGCVFTEPITSMLAEHQFPHEWYLLSIRDPMHPYVQGWGYPLSKEYSAALPSHDEYHQCQDVKAEEQCVKTLRKIGSSDNVVHDGDFSGGTLGSWAVLGAGSVEIIEYPTGSGNSVAQLTSQSPIALSQQVTLPSRGFRIAFAYGLPEGSGFAQVSLGTTVVHTIDAQSSTAGPYLAPYERVVLESGAGQSTRVDLVFEFNGSVGDHLLLDDVQITGLDFRPVFRRGDANADARIDISDGIFTLNFLFIGNQNSECVDSADTNDDGTLDISDGIAVFNFLFLGFMEPPAPGSFACGPDPTEDSLPCVEYPDC